MYIVASYDFAMNLPLSDRQEFKTLAQAEKAAKKLAGEYCQDERPVRETWVNPPIVAMYTTECDFGSIVVDKAAIV